VSDARRRAAEERARAAEHRARAHELRARANGSREDLADRLHVEEVLAEIAELRASAFDDQSGVASARRSYARDGAVARDLAIVYAEWERMHDALARTDDARAAGEVHYAAMLEREAHAHRERALAAEERIEAVRHRVEAEALRKELGATYARGDPAAGSH
jgi:hypothetical protein